MDVIKPPAPSARYEAASPDVASEPSPLGHLRGFRPGWFGAVMGMAIIGVGASLNPAGSTALAPPARIGWWGFTFPLGAHTLATLTLAKAWNLSGLDWAGAAALFVLLGAFWLVVSARTLWAVGTGEDWRGALDGPNGPTPGPLSWAAMDGGAGLGPARSGLDGPHRSSGMEEHHGQAR